PAGAAHHSQPRLDRVLHQVLDEALEAAVRTLAVPDGEEVCIRRAAVRTRLRLSAPDAVLASDWSRAIAVELRRILDSGDPQLVVRYPSLRQALAQVVTSLAVGDTRRAWAWRQLGLPVDDRPGRAIARTLVAHAELAPALLREVAGAGRLPSLLE